MESNATPGDGSSLPLVPQIERDETLYSWCATIHAMAARSRSGDTSRALFGNDHSPRQHDLPRGLVFLQEYLPGENLLEILRSHTIAACYLPFLAPEEISVLAEDIAQTTKFHWRRMLLGASRTRPVFHPLRFCAKCCAEDRLTVGRSYWHIQHQLPATWSCIRHDEPLWTLPGHPRRWRLPSEGMEKSSAMETYLPQAAAITAAVGLSLSSLRSVNCDSLRSNALRRLRDAGVIHSLGGARHDRITRWFQDTHIGRMCADKSSAMSALGDGSWIPAQLWRRKFNHPARWITLWSALNWSTAEEAAAAFVEAAENRMRSEEGQLFLFQQQDPPVRAPAHVYAAFESCESYAAAMALLRVRRADVVRWLEADPELRRVWKQGAYSRRLAATMHRLQAAASLSSADFDIPRFLKDNAADIRWLATHADASYHALIGKLNRQGARQRTFF